jgi:uncharacterized repeat protein (TIGR01451 family)
MGIHTAPPTAADVPWLSENPISGTVATNNALSVDVVFDAGAVSEYGTYTAHLLVGSNDIYNPSVSIPVTMTVVPSAPILNIAKSGNPTSVQAGGLLVYTIVVGNTGNADATGITVTDTIPANTAFVSADAGGTRIGDQVQWSGKTVPADGALTVHFTVRVDSPLPNGTILNNDAYGVTCTEGVSATGSPVQTTVHSAPVLAIAKSGSPDPVQAGGLLTYTILVENTGNADATGVTVTDTIPANTAFVSADAGGTRVGDQVQWSGKTVPADTILMLHFTVRVDSPLPNGTILNNDAYGATCTEGVSATGSPVTIPVENGWIVYLPLTMRNY